RWMRHERRSGGNTPSADPRWSAALADDDAGRPGVGAVAGAGATAGPRGSGTRRHGFSRRKADAVEPDSTASLRIPRGEHPARGVGDLGRDADLPDPGPRAGHD